MPRTFGTHRPSALARRVFLIALGGVFFGACTSGGSQRPARLAPPSEKTVIGAGDVFTMEIVGEKELPREYQVASDGTADLPYVRTIHVEGLEPQEVARVVRKLLIDKQILTDPVVIVQVKEYNSRRVTVLGQVAKPGSFPLTTGLTLIQAISLAGGLTAIANDDRVTITRKTGDSTTQTVVVSVDYITEGKAEDVPLQAGDRIYVYERLF